MMDGVYSQESDKMQSGDLDRFHRSQNTVLFVGNLPFQTPWQHVKDHFRSAGKVRYTDLIADRSGRPKGSALVTMMTEDAAENAIRMFNETDFQGRHLIVRKFDEGPRPALVQRDMMPPYGNTNAHRRAPYPGANLVGAADGNGANGGVPTVASNGGYYQSVVSPNPANAYVRSAPYHVGDSTDLGMAAAGQFVDLAGEQLPKPRSQQVPEAGRKLFVSNLPFDCTTSALRETFQQVGAVERAEIILGRNGKSRGMGIVMMKSEEEARIAIAEFDGIEMANRAMSVRLDNKV